MASLYNGHTQKNGAVLIVNTIKTAPLFCVNPVFLLQNMRYDFHISITVHLYELINL
jgi:hypothetical protein